LGVGILALPKDIHELGWIAGLGFLVCNLPINYYAGEILAQTATHVENTTNVLGASLRKVSSDFEMVATSEKQNDGEEVLHHPEVKDGILRDRGHQHVDEANVEALKDVSLEEEEVDAKDAVATHDLVGITNAIFPDSLSTKMVMLLYFTNIFLVLGDYILVMSYAVAAMLGDKICLPWAGVLASFLMFALSQLRTMAMLGREASAISLACLFIVLVQCLVASVNHEEPAITDTTTATELASDSSILRKFSALASIGFACGSQKLFLNIRHEMRHKEEAPRTLALSLTTYGTAYIIVVIAAGPDPPALLFEAIPEGFSRRTAGLLLWIHVAVSYAINSQAICSSLDRRLSFWPDHPRERWMVLTGVMALSSYTVANAIPFFQDLVSLIGALTTVPLTLSLPPLLYRYAIQQVSSWRPALGSSSSYSLVVYSVLFLVVGLAGSLYSIDRDWAHHGKPFACA
jgi:amino acid permease